MIFDSLKNAAVYRGLSPRFAKAIDFISDPPNHSLPLGRYAVDGDAIYAIVMSYTTKTPADTFWEAHRKYIDLQFIVSGVEAMAYAPLESMTASAEYDAEKDFVAYTGTGQTLIVPAQHFTLFWPHDVHMPSLTVGSPSIVKKIVLKVAVD